MTNLEFAKSILNTTLSDIQYKCHDIVQSPEMLRRSLAGDCWEQAELERQEFDAAGIPCQTYWIDSNYMDAGYYQTHTFLVFENLGKFYWLEHAFGDHIGVHEYGSLKELLTDVRNKYKRFYENNRQHAMRDFRIREYKPPKLPASSDEFIRHCTNGKSIKIEDL